MLCLVPGVCHAIPPILGREGLRGQMNIAPLMLCCVSGVGASRVLAPDLSLVASASEFTWSTNEDWIRAGLDTNKIDEVVKKNKIGVSNVYRGLPTVTPFGRVIPSSDPDEDAKLFENHLGPPESLSGCLGCPSRTQTAVRS